MAHKMGSYLFYLYAAAAFVLCQYNVYMSFSALPRYSLLFAALFLVLAFLLFFAAIRRPNIFYAFSFIPVIYAVKLFYAEPMNLIYFVFYGVFVILLYAGFVYDKKNPKIKPIVLDSEKKGNVYLWIAGSFVFFAAGMSAVLLYLNSFDKKIMWFLPLRIKGYPGNMSGYDGVMQDVFKEYWALVIVLIYLGLLLLFINSVLKGRMKKESHMVSLLLLFSFAGKIVFTLLTTQGFDVIGAKMKGPLLSAYYFWAAGITNLQEFIADYVNKYQSYHASSHLKGHPPMPVVFYWFIIKWISKDPGVAGVIYSFVTSLTVVPLYFLTKHLTGIKKAGFLAALFYALTPNSLVLSVVGTDGIIVFWVACFAALAVIGASKGDIRRLFAGGVFFGMGTYFSFGIWPLLMFVFFMILKWEKLSWNKEFAGEFLKWVRNVFAVLAGIVFIHLLIWFIFKGDFNYLESFNMAKKLSVSMMLARPYEVWSWANFFHWGLYITVPVLALFFFRFFRTGYIAHEADRFTLMALAVVAMQFLASLGRAETHRMYMYLIVFVIPVAVMALLRRTEGGFDIKDRDILIITVMVFLNSVFLQVFVADFL